VIVLVTLLDTFDSKLGRHTRIEGIQWYDATACRRNQPTTYAAFYRVSLTSFGAIDSISSCSIWKRRSSLSSPDSILIHRHGHGRVGDRIDVRHVSAHFDDVPDLLVLRVDHRADAVTGQRSRDLPAPLWPGE